MANKRPLLASAVVGLLGGIGGGGNAALCYAGIPVSVTTFQWHIVPAGFLHGAVLAFLGAAAAQGMRARSMARRWAALPVLGWLAGWLSYIPLQLSIHAVDSLHPAQPAHLSFQDVLNAVTGPFSSTEGIWSPYFAFGLVSAWLYLWLTVLGGLSNRRLGWHLAMGGLSGVLGSLWWWSAWHPWYLSLLHGAIWGSCVGFGTWKSFRSPA